MCLSQVRKVSVDGGITRAGLKANAGLLNRIAPAIDSACIAFPNSGADGRVVAGRGTLDSDIESKPRSTFGYGRHPRRQCATTVMHRTIDNGREQRLVTNCSLEAPSFEETVSLSRSLVCLPQVVRLRFPSLHSRLPSCYRRIPTGAAKGINADLDLGSAISNCCVPLLMLCGVQEGAEVGGWNPIAIGADPLVPMRVRNIG